MARAVLKRPKVILMDEATSSIDIETEKVFRTVLGAMKDVTIVLVAHSIWSAAGCDEVLVLNRGALVENGEIF